METEWIGELDGQAAADALAANHARLVEAEATEFGLAAHWADLHAIDPTAPPCDLPGAGRVLPGTERAKRYGGHGTPEVGEFAAGELAALLGRGYAAGVALIADALDVRHRLPVLWAAVMAGTARVWQAREVAKRTRSVGLSAAQARWVDAQTTPYLASLPWTRFTDLLEAKIIEADPAAARARAEAAALDRFVATGQSNEHGLKTLIAKAEAGQVIYLVAVIDRIAEILLLEGDTDPIGPRRSKALALLADPARALRLLERHATRTHPATEDPDDPATEDPDPDDSDDAEQAEADPAPSSTCACTGATTPAAPAALGLDPAKLRPRAVLYIHTSREAFEAALAGEESGVARMEGVGPITTDQAATFLGHSHVTVKEVIDLATDQPVDAYEIPDRMREQLRLRSPAQCFPYAGPATPHTDGDHTRPFLPPTRGVNRPGKSGDSITGGWSHGTSLELPA